MRLGIATAWVISTAFAAGSGPAMLMDTASAVEVTDGFTPALPEPSMESSRVAPSPGAQETAPSKDCFILGSKTFSVPFTVNSSGVQPSEVHVFVKRDPSQDWDLLERKRPDAASQAFQFTAMKDGEYWFATRTIDSRGQSHPSGVMQPQLKVFVDTTKPNIVLGVNADADGSVIAKVVIQDATPLKNVQLRYATDSVAEWRRVDLTQLPPDGSVPIKPDAAWQQISVQCIVTDTPGNQSVMQKLVKRPRMAKESLNRYAGGAATPMLRAAPGVGNARDVGNAGGVGNAGDAEATPHDSANRLADHSRDQAGGLQIQPAPYRSDYVNRLRTETVSNPVIQLDRNRRTPPPAPGVENALGYAAEPATTEFRGSRDVPPANRVADLNAFRLNPAQGSTAAPQVANVSPELSAPPSMSGFPFPNAPTETNPQPQSMRMNFPTLNPAQRAEAARSFASQFAQPQTSPATAPENIPPPAGLLETPNNNPETGLNGTPSAVTGESAFAGENPTTSDESASGVDEPARRPQSPAEAMRPMGEASTPETTGITAGGIPSPGPQAANPGLTSSTETGPAADTSDKNARPAEDRYSANRAVPTADQLQKSMQRAPQRYSDSLRFSLEYELEAVGSLGVDAVELYGTVDSGRTWQLWGRDPDRTSPFDIETKEEGTFGFRIVVVGQNGLASPRPLAGESPDIAIVVDTTSPTVRITGAQYGEGDRVGSLVIRYECEDSNLKSRPVALSFSDRVDGPWTTIAAGLRNDGDYVWPADPKLPRKIYLRVDVTDEAGNVGTYILDEPIDAQGMAPRARIRGFQTLSGEPEPSSDEQTAKRSWSIFQ